MASSIAVVKGPKASGKVFGFRIAPKTKDKSGRIEVGDTAKVIKLDSPEALKINLESKIGSYIDGGFLAKADQPQPVKKD